MIIIIYSDIYIYIYTGWVKKNLVWCYRGIPCKDIQKIIIRRFPLYEYTLFPFYKQNSIFKSKDAFCVNKFIKRHFLVKKSSIKGFYESPFENMSKEIIWCCYFHKNDVFCSVNQTLS